MIRAALVLVGLGSLVAIELGTPPRVAKAVNQPLIQSSVVLGDSRNILAKADRLEIPYFQNELATQPITFVERMPPAGSTPNNTKEASKIVTGDRHDAKTKKVASIRPKPRPKTTKTVATTYRSKAPLDVRQCRPNAFDSFLKALNLPSGCEA